ncbi:adenosylcobinamide-GDP ribazoletransferase [Rhodovulum sp. FJ3]|uniref:adenosylcobinamide-GDP ribazoletransferase n=1 Tax=Rhodovulum sp. FJ3 TaxID=3079053 RepID=UPI00293DA82E|nr:adenosylcobinamide-GDP ribazoletransferase [Rhodovulum sp. FJ3]MDV4166687.1 adenosylcobinamide-GDP ribazoletransferase [Rhodovulum sp. FJ3]
MIRARLSEMQVGVMMLTRLPAGQLRDPVPSIAASAWSFPFVGAGIGAILWGICAGLLALGVPAAMAAVLTVLAGAMITGGLHYDGLADFADGIWGGHDIARRLEIMRDSRIGSYGVIALILSIAVQVTGITALAGTPAMGAAFIAVAVFSRLCMLAVLLILPPARADGLGHSAVGGRFAVALPGMAVAVIAGGALGGAAVVLAVVMALSAAWVAWVARAKVGGQTGDVLGATQLVSEIAGWVVLSALIAG